MHMQVRSYPRHKQKSFTHQIMRALKFIFDGQFFIKYSFTRSHAVGHIERRGKQAHSQTNKKTPHETAQKHTLCMPACKYEPCTVIRACVHADT